MVAGMAVSERTPDATDDAGRPDRSRPDRGRHRWIRVAALCAVLAACVGVSVQATTDEISANARTDQAHRALDATRDHLGLVLAGLAAVRADRRTVDGQVGLEAATLAQDTTQLQGVETALASARTGVADQTSAVHDLQTCLGGVEQGLNALSVGDRVHALDALDAVSATCTAAIAANG